MHEISLKVGITPKHPCSYLYEQKEQLLVLMEHTFFCPQGYAHLLSIGFRRSGNDIYRPQCPACNACQSVRIDTQNFTPTRSQRRIAKKGVAITTIPNLVDKPEYYELYTRYIEVRHRDGSMYPPSRKQYDNFLTCQWMRPCFLEFRLDKKLIAIAVTDIMDNCLSAMYTFFDPDYAEFSLGTLGILRQIELAQNNDKKWLYLGYYVENCKKMSYKNQFKPYQILTDGQWHGS